MFEYSLQATVLCKYLTEELQKEGVIVAECSNMKPETALKSRSVRAILNSTAKSRLAQAMKTLLSLKKEMSFYIAPCTLMPNLKIFGTLSSFDQHSRN